MPLSPRPVRGAGLISVALLFAVPVLAVSRTVDHWTRYAKLRGYPDGLLSDMAFGALDLDRPFLMTLFPFDALMVTLLPMALLPWAVPALANAVAIDPERQFWFTGRGVVCGLLAPVTNLWWSRRIITDIQGASRPEGSRGRAWWVLLITAAATAVPLIVVGWGMRNPFLGRRSHDAYELVWLSALEGSLSTAQAVLMVIAAFLLARTIFRINQWQEARAGHESDPRAPAGTRCGLLLASASMLPVLVTLVAVMLPHWMLAAPAVFLWIGYLALTRATARGHRVMLTILAAVTAWFALLVPLSGILAPISLLLFLFIMVLALVTATQILQDLDRLPGNRGPRQSEQPD